MLQTVRWKVTPDELVANLPGVAADPASGGHALPVHARARLEGAGSEADAPDADARLVELVKDILKTHGGEFDPSRISRQKVRWRDERPLETFNKLLTPGGLKGFLDKHSDKFAWRQQADNKGMLITWANWVTQEGRVPPWETAPQQGVASGSGLQRPEGAPPTHRPQEAASGSGQNALPLAWPDNSPPSGSGQDSSNPWEPLA